MDNPNDVNEAAWKSFRNKTNAIIKKVQENYYKNIINSHSNDSKNLWKTFGNILVKFMPEKMFNEMKGSSVRLLDS